MNALIQAQDLQKTYQLGKVKVQALRNISVSIDRGEFVTVCGPSGSGKTTLLNLIGFLDSPTSGKIHFDGIEMKYNGYSNLHRLRLEKLGFIFQSFNLMPVLTAYENVEYPLLLTRKSSGERKIMVERILKEVNLWDWRRHKPHELSGGQRQRVAIARALVNRPQLVLADEPTANIDSATTEDLLDLMRTLNEEEKVTFLFSTHDPLVVKYARRILKLHDGVMTDDQKK